MAEPIVFPSLDGQEVQLLDIDNIGTVAGLSDDRVFAELLRLHPYDGSNVFKAILPYGSSTLLASADPGPTVAPSGSANGSVLVNPFRAVIGSRNTANSPPSPNPASGYQTTSLANWRDIRSVPFVGTSSSLTALLPFSANSSGNPRWDLVYAAVGVDANGPNVNRRVKNGSTLQITTQSVAAYVQSTVSVGTVTGTPGASPSLPSLPADVGGSYNIPLAYVRIPNGFSSGSTVSARDIRSYSTSAARYRKIGLHSRPATGNNDLTGSYSPGWAAGSPGTRPAAFLPPDWLGGEIVTVAVDASNANPTNWSFANSAVVDSSIDWRNRIVTVIASTAASGGLATDPLASNSAVPYGFGGTTTVGQANTCKLDGNLVASCSTVFYAALGSGHIGLFCDNNGNLSTPGNLLFYGNGAPLGFFYATLLVSAQFPNF